MTIDLRKYPVLADFLDDDYSLELQQEAQHAVRESIAEALVNALIAQGIPASYSVENNSWILDVSGHSFEMEPPTVVGPGFADEGYEVPAEYELTLIDLSNEESVVELAVTDRLSSTEVDVAPLVKML